MSTSSSITCPHCGDVISLDEALTHQFQDQLKKELQEQSQAVLIKKVREAEEAAKRATESLYKDKHDDTLKKLQELQEEKIQKDRALKSMMDQEVKLRQEKNALEEKERQLDLQIQRTLD